MHARWRQQGWVSFLLCHRMPEIVSLILGKGWFWLLVSVHSCLVPWLWACGQAEQHGTVCGEAKLLISQRPGREEERSQYLLLGIPQGVPSVL